MYKGEFPRLSEIISSLRSECQVIEKNTAGSAMSVIGKKPHLLPIPKLKSAERPAIFPSHNRHLRSNGSLISAGTDYQHDYRSNLRAQPATLFALSLLYRERPPVQDHP